jgi:hypothetical protein
MKTLVSVFLGVVVLALLLVMPGMARSGTAAPQEGWQALNATQMAAIRGGAAKHCVDDPCVGKPCYELEGGGYLVVIGNGTTGRYCGGSPATCCSASNDAPCLTGFFGCNSTCTSCSSQTEEGTHTTCTSSS